MIDSRKILLGAAMTVAVMASACTSSGGRLPAGIEPPPVTGPAEEAQYRLGTGDVVGVSVWKNPDLSVNRVPVRPDGYISVPLVGDILAGGRTPNEIARDTEQKLLQFIRTPRVSIIVEELNSAEFLNRVRVVGGVQAPMSVSHRDGMTVIDLVLEAGGVNDFAAPEGSKLYRTVEGEPRIFPIYLDSILRDGVLDTNYPLMPGDVISIPERRF